MTDDNATLVERILNKQASQKELETLLQKVKNQPQLREIYEVERALLIASKLIEKNRLMVGFKKLDAEHAEDQESDNSKMKRYMNAAFENKEIVERFSSQDGLITYDTIKKFLGENEKEED